MENFPAPEPAGPPEPPRPAFAPVAPLPRRRRGRTALIIAVAAVFGIVGGTATGYAVQADRPPTPLAALSQPDLAYPAKPLPPGKAADALSSDGTGLVKTDGDLRKLLLSKPAGARYSKAPWIVDGWSSLTTYAAGAGSPDMMFEFLADKELRRIASRSWDSDGNRQSSIDLLQFRAGDSNGGLDFLTDQMSFVTAPVSDGGTGSGGKPIGDSDTDSFWLYPQPGSLPFYRARALAQRGGVVMDINVFDTEPISEKYIRTLAERQLERL
ncbi:hypothetical protein QR77_21620 [Streptomyces sp. 150FB]|uniref:hypothetical protein n=1 Tax=Streptomyces sp. 150FB TaxID=1576605 RepID=UPI0005890DBD|nr:hypothetical protein [Streptomyces sp. 150FB]KIF75784.1 hypothetical protein QR77_21620 [Streptomyces sp. 150FB]